MGYVTKEKIDQLDQLVKKGTQMRMLQKRYFEYRDSRDLKMCKKVEKEFDQMIGDFLSGQQKLKL